MIFCLVIYDECILSGAVIESNVQIDQSIICDGVVVGAGAVIPRGCVLSYGVVIGAGAVLPEFTRVSRHSADTEEADECDLGSSASLGNGSQGFVWKSHEGMIVYGIW